MTKSRWKLREPYFRGANTYAIASHQSGQKLEFVVDENGMFELDRAPDFPLGMFAKSVMVQLP